MANFDEHIEQARKNLAFLSEVNQKIANYYDWQVTICFYTSLHLVNAHLSKHNLQYRKHNDVNYALNPFVQLSISKLPEEEYDCYMSLQRLSRRSRYLANEKDNNLKSIQAFLTYEKHLSKAIKHLDKLIYFFATKYAVSFDNKDFTCTEIGKGEKLNYFKLT